MNQKSLLGIVAVVVIAVAAYFIFFSGDAGGRCSEEAMTALAPKMEEAVKKVLTEDPSKAEAIMQKAQAIAAAGQAGNIEEACELSYKLAEELGVK